MHGQAKEGGCEMHRLIVDSAELAKERPSLSSEAARHLKVVRPKDGEEIELFDGRGLKRVYRFDAQSRTLANPSPAVALPPPKIRFTLFACVTKGSRWDWTVEKATELGVTRIVPVISERTIVRIQTSERAAKRERWMRIAEEAARQSDAVWLPEILPAVDFVDALPLVKRTSCCVGALAQPPPAPLLAALRTAMERPNEDGLAVFVGPEGDFTPDELSALLEIATPASFGPTILRAETAAIFALSVLAASSHAAI